MRLQRLISGYDTEAGGSPDNQVLATPAQHGVHVSRPRSRTQKARRSGLSD
jgi:hypothetical protein